MHRYGYFMIDSHIDDVWNRTLAFWQNKKCKISEQFISVNSLFRELSVRHSFSMHPYGTSMGETYEMTFGYNPEKSVTYVSVGIKFSGFGRGFTWLVPQEMMGKWAKEMEIQPIKLMKKQNLKYLEIFNDITNISNQLTPSQTRMFCPYCGSDNSLTSKFCSKCGINLENT